MNYLFRSSSKFLYRIKPQGQIFSFRPYNYFCSQSSPQQQNAEVLEEVRARIFQVLKSAAKCKQDKLTEKATFEELGFDSLDSVELVVALEENFGFDIQNTEAEQIQGVGEAIAIFYKYTFEKLNSEALTETKTEKQ